MAQTITFNGVSYTIPDVGDTGWGQNLTNYFVGIPQGCLQKTGGVFTLTADVDFGASFGLLPQYIKSRASNPATAGILRLAVGDLIEWRNNGNSANLTLGLNATDFLSFSGNGIIANNHVDNYTTTVTSAGTTTLTVASTKQQYFTGSTTQNLVLPDATTLPGVGFQFRIVNLSSGAVTIKDNSGSTLLALPGVSWTLATCTNIGTTAGTWDLEYSAVASGTVTSVAMTVPNTLSVSGSPITTSGTLALSSKAITAKSTGYTLTGSDYIVTFDATSAGLTATLPTAASASGLTFVIKKIDSSTNTVTLATTSAQTIDGNASGALALATQNESITLASDGSNWIILDHKCNTSWASFTMTIGGSTSAPTKGTTTTDRARWRRVADSMEIEYDYIQTVAGSAGSGTYLFPLPVSAAMNTTFITTSTSHAQITSGYGYAGTSSDGLGSLSEPIGVVPYDSTHFMLVRQQDSAGNLQPTRDIVGSSVFSLSGTNVFYSFRVRVPISGWFA